MTFNPSSGTRIGVSHDLPAAPPLTPRVEVRRGLPDCENTVVGRGFSREVNGKRYVEPRLEPDPARPWVWFGIFLIAVLMGAVFFEFALRPLLSVLIDFGDWLGIAAPH